MASSSGAGNVVNSALLCMMCEVLTDTVNGSMSCGSESGDQHNGLLFKQEAQKENPIHLIYC